MAEMARSSHGTRACRAARLPLHHREVRTLPQTIPTRAPCPVRMLVLSISLTIRLWCRPVRPVRRRPRLLAAAHPDHDDRELIEPVHDHGHDDGLTRSAPGVTKPRRSRLPRMPCASSCAGAVSWTMPTWRAGPWHDRNSITTEGQEEQGDEAEVGIGVSISSMFWSGSHTGTRGVGRMIVGDAHPREEDHRRGHPRPGGRPLSGVSPGDT